MDGAISISWNDGTDALWADMTDEQLDKVADFIEKNFKQADSIGG
jgi:hypothetical protein